MPKLDTSIDRLVEYVKLKKSCTVDDAAKSLGVPSKQVEELVEILAESGLIDVRYDFSGIRLSPKILDKGGDAGKVEKKLNAIERLEGIKKELQDAENMFIFSEKDISRKVENAKAHFREIERLDFSGENSIQLKNKALELDNFIKVFEEKIDSLEKNALEMRKEVDSFSLQIDKQQTKKMGFRMRFSNIFSKVRGAFRRRRGEKKDISDNLTAV
ncbi:hypothetical protein HY989_02280 [Candidatus Micrarchaeota archaeon]|nr:hypothetical protein [Candidatus Micrarchaeota archaeon]